MNDPDIPRPGDPEALPIHLLPPVLRDMACTIAAVTQTPMDAAVAAVLGAVSVALVGKALVQIRPDGKWIKPIHTYVGIELPSGVGKDPLLSMATDAIRRWETQHAQTERRVRARAAERNALAGERLARARRAVAAPGASDKAWDDYERAKAQFEEVASAPTSDYQLIIQDATEEAVVNIMAAEGGRVACVDSEAALLEMAAGRYNGGDPRVALLTHGWDGASMRVNRVSRPPVDIPSANLAILVGIQPGVLGRMRNAETMRNRGVWARMLWAAPAMDWSRVATGPDVPALDLSAVERYEAMLLRLLSLLSPSPRMMTMSPEALQGVYELERLRAHGMGPGGMFEAIPGWGGKLPDHGARLAALLTVAHRAGRGHKDPFNDPIPGWAMDAATRLVLAFATHVTKVIGGAGMDPLLRDATYVLGRALSLAPENRTVRELQRACDSRPSLPDMAALMPILDDLVRRHCLRTYKEKTGGCPKTWFEIHPLILRMSSNDTFHIGLGGASPCDGDKGDDSGPDPESPVRSSCYGSRPQDDVPDSAEWASDPSDVLKLGMGV